MKDKQANNGKDYNLAICDEGKKVKLFLQFDIDGDGDLDAVVTFLDKKLGGDVEADCIEKLRKFFDVFGFPRSLIILSTLEIDKKQWKTGFKEIKRIDLMPVKKKNEVLPVVTWFFSINAGRNTLSMVLRTKDKLLSQESYPLPVTSVVAVVRGFLGVSFIRYSYPGKIVNEWPEKFSFEEFKEFFHFDDITIDVIPVDNKEHLIIKEKEKQ